MNRLTQPTYNFLLLACKRNERERSFVLQCHRQPAGFILSLQCSHDAAAAAFTTCGKGSFYIFWSHLK